MGQFLESRRYVIFSCDRIWLIFLSGGFVITYFNVKWAVHSGPAVSFGCQAAIVFAAFGSIVAVQVYGHKWRVMFPAPAAEN